MAIKLIKIEIYWHRLGGWKTIWSLFENRLKSIVVDMKSALELTKKGCSVESYGSGRLRGFAPP